MRLLLIGFLLFSQACGPAPAEAAQTVAATSPAPASGPYLRMKVDGLEVNCTNVFGAYNPKGYPTGTTILAGDMKDDGSQPFNVALYDIPSTGVYTITAGQDPAKWAVQYIDPTATNPFLIRHLAVNNKPGSSFEIRFTKLSADDLEGTFEGFLTSDNGEHIVHITEGKFDTY